MEKWRNFPFPPLPQHTYTHTHTHTPWEKRKEVPEVQRIPEGRALGLFFRFILRKMAMTKG